MSNKDVEEKMTHVKALLEIYRKCDETGKCPKCGNDTKVERLASGKLEGHGRIFCTNPNCGITLVV